MSTESLKQKITTLLSSGQGRLDVFLGEPDLGPLRKWFGLVCLIILEVFFSLTLASNLASNVRIIFAQSQAVETLRNKIRNIEDGYKTIQEKSTAAENLLGSLAGSKLNSEFLEKITLWTNLNQITLQGINFFPPQASSQPGLLKRQVDLIVLGEYESLLTFVETINRQEPSTVVAGLALSLNAKKSNTNQIESKISLVSYYSTPDDK